MAYWDEVGDPRRLLRGKERGRVGAADGGFPCPMRGSGKRGTSRSPVSRPLLGIEMDDGRTASVRSVVLDGDHDAIVRVSVAYVVTRSG